MAQEASEIRSFRYGSVYIAPVGTDFPTSISEAVAGGEWIEVGHITEEGPRPTFAKNVETRNSWQADDVWAATTQRLINVAFDLMQWNQWTVKLAVGEFTVTEPSPDEYEFDLPADDAHTEWALILEAEDGDDCHYRFCFPRTFNQAPTELAFIRTGPTTIPIDMKILKPDAGAAKGFVQTDDPNIGDILEAAS